MDTQIIMFSIATIQNGVARADGKLWLTQDYLHFEPYNKQFGLGPYKLERESILKVDKCIAKGGGIIPLTSDAIEITFQDGSSYRFILANTSKWLTMLSH